jgi:regulator of protease activity HflC (stomatin/prohibitin superfamily)
MRIGAGANKPGTFSGSANEQARVNTSRMLIRYESERSKRRETMQVVTSSPGFIKVLREYERGVVFRFGKLKKVKEPGIRLLIPVADRMMRVSLRTVTMPVPSQSIITRDNVSIEIAAVAYYHVNDPVKSVIAIENVGEAINQIAQTTVRNVVGQSSLDELLQKTESINEKIKVMLDAQTEPWGIEVTVVEIKDILLPDNLKRAMAKEAEAEREKRAKIIAAEGELVASEKLSEAARVLSTAPVSIQLRTLQTLAEISIEKNSTIVFPVEFLTGMKSLFTGAPGEGDG